MAKKLSLNPTLAGACSVAIWGSALPIVKLVEDRIGLLAFMGFAYSAMAAFGVISIGFDAAYCRPTSFASARSTRGGSFSFFMRDF